MRIADQKRADFVKRFRSLSRRFSLWQVWSDFITMFAIALSNAVDSRYRTEREAMYKRIIEKYEKAERTVFPELVEDVVNAFDADREQDFLGSAYMELDLGNHWIGQFFTPYDICRCMAEITTGDVVEQINRDGFVTLNDCACGAGATLIAAVNQIEKQLFEAKSPLRWQNHVLVTAQDLDFTTGMMCYIQLSLLGCAGYIKIGNTLTDPMHDGDDPAAYWYTPGYFSSVWQLRRIFRSMDRLFKEVKI